MTAPVNLTTTEITTEGALLGWEAAPVLDGSFWSHQFVNAGETVSLSERLGYSFTVGAADLLCNTLGYYGGNLVMDENVRIHRVSDGVLIAEGAITPVPEAWVDLTVPEFSLEAGVQYAISHRFTGIVGTVRPIRRNHSGLVFYEGITLVGYLFGSNDDLPTSGSANAYAAARFGYVA